MGIDGKYGRVTTERGTIGDDEPVVVFRAQDQLLPMVLTHYYELCARAGSPAHHLQRIAETLAEVARWQVSNKSQVPQSSALAPSKTPVTVAWLK